MEAGWGVGHTFPGVLSSKSKRLNIAGVDVPTWLIRIDYVFHSSHFHAVEAHIGPWDGYSDHRPVIAKLVLKAQ
jgi:endonuclease/exonuclease/phosphatase family metal-dependent hydrolase